MTALARIIRDLSPGAKIAALIATALLVSGAVALLAGVVAGAAMLAGLFVVALLMLTYGLILQSLQRKAAAPLDQGLASNWGAAPMGITEPARRARLDDMRKSFEKGLETFRQSGKSLYALPWYLVVGEPGSGKTEAIRHSSVGFPPGLNDQYQGVGGTLNMNWWFTNHAVILDTAGRLIFEEVEPGTTTEWQSFLKLLKKHRPGCPINGMLLVIPAESLIRDSEQEIATKAGKIAQQLDMIQRSLGVRFPVFVVITKADLINGFREFFDKTTDPALQHQIFGWSSPDGLDAPFRPELVEEYLRTVQARLERRRLGMLIDPVNSDDAKKRRTDQVDALYAFPDSIVRVAPRLRQYLSTIFVAGEWASKPLFLRGIYFTSSMREGTALDADLAEALGVSVESLPEGKVWERDKAFFLRDLFMNKVFREKGLVTPAASTSKLQRGRALALLGTAAVGVLALGALTLISTRSLGRTVVGPSTFWSSAADAYIATEVPADKSRGTGPQLMPIVSQVTLSDEDFKYRGSTGDDARPLATVVAPDARKTRAGFMAEARDRAQDTLEVPLAFYPAAMTAGDTGGDILREQRLRAARALFESSVLRPLVDAAKVRLKADVENKSFSPEAAAALAQLVRLEAAITRGPSPALKPLDLKPLLEYAVKGNQTMATPEAREGAAMLAQLNQEHFAAPGVWPPDTMRSPSWPLIAEAGKRLSEWAPAHQSPLLVPALAQLDAEFTALKEAAADPARPGGATPLPADVLDAASAVKRLIDASK